MDDRDLNALRQVMHRWQTLADFFATSPNPTNRAAAKLVTSLLADIRSALPSSDAAAHDVEDATPSAPARG